MATISQINGFFIRKLNEYGIDNMNAYIYTYDNISNENLKKVFSKIHYEINSLFNFMNNKIDINRHFNADQSRELIKWLNEINEFKNTLLNTQFQFNIINYYEKIIEECEKFLCASGGSDIPEEFKKININNIEPIFYLNEIVKVHSNISVERKIIGSGSYAKVYKYKDPTYNKYFAIKKAEKNLNYKEIERFKLEFKDMKKMNSPYVIEVYSFDEKKMEYIMEYADYTLEKFILENNSKLSNIERKNIIFQILKAFEYIHSKKLLHRDVSFRNILIKKYDKLNIIKISDFGLVKRFESMLTSLNTEFKGSLNDKSLEHIGFDNYTIEHETYALVRVIYFILTGKTNIEFSKITNEKLRIFVENGLNSDITKRYKSVIHLRAEFNNINI